jgi:hypothetical protein
MNNGQRQLKTSQYDLCNNKKTHNKFINGIVILQHKFRICLYMYIFLLESK